MTYVLLQILFKGIQFTNLPYFALVSNFVVKKKNFVIVQQQVFIMFCILVDEFRGAYTILPFTAEVLELAGNAFKVVKMFD